MSWFGVLRLLCILRCLVANGSRIHIIVVRSNSVFRSLSNPGFAGIAKLPCYRCSEPFRLATLCNAGYSLRQLTQGVREVHLFNNSAIIQNDLGDDMNMQDGKHALLAN